MGQLERCPLRLWRVSPSLVIALQGRTQTLYVMESTRTRYQDASPMMFIKAPARPN
jgi:hypothetical protein